MLHTILQLSKETLPYSLVYQYITVNLFYKTKSFNVYSFSVDFLADLYIHGETTYEIVDQGKMKTVAVNRTEYMLTTDAISEFKTIHDSWELDICEKNPYDALIGGKLGSEQFHKTKNSTKHSKQQCPGMILSTCTTLRFFLSSLQKININQFILHHIHYRTKLNFMTIKNLTYSLAVS